MKNAIKMNKVTKWYYNLSTIMKRAHEIYSISMMDTFSESLKKAWKEAKIMAANAQKKLEAQARKIIDTIADILCDEEDRTEAAYQGRTQGASILKEEKIRNARMIRILMDSAPETVVDELNEVLTFPLDMKHLPKWRRTTILLEKMGVWV